MKKDKREEDGRMKTLKAVVPIAIVLLGAAVAGLMIANREPPQQRPPEEKPVLVRVMPVQSEDVEMIVRTHGTVEPRREIKLIPQVSGRVEWVAPSFASGGFFSEGEALVRVDARDYELAVVRARAQVTQAEVAVAREEAEAASARREWEQLGKGEATALALREPQLAEARAALEAARAAWQLAELDLERSELKAPFDGRVASKQVDAGQYVTAGTVLGRLYAVDVVEVRLPLPVAEMAYVDLPLQMRGGPEVRNGPVVRLRAEFAGGPRVWIGRVVRTEGEVDRRTRMVTAVAQVEDPFGGHWKGGVPLAPGLFVEGEIVGKKARGVVVLPRVALRGKDRVLVVDEEDRLRFRTVEVLRLERDRVLIREGLESGERVCLSPLDTPLDGMKVRTIREDEERLDNTGRLESEGSSGGDVRA